MRLITESKTKPNRKLTTTMTIYLTVTEYKTTDLTSCFGGSIINQADHGTPFMQSHDRMITIELVPSGGPINHWWTCYKSAQFKLNHGDR